MVIELSGITIELVPIPPGSFQMGSPNEQFGEAPLHTVTVARSFYLGKLPVTQRQWSAVCGANPSAFPLSGEHPVDNVSWLDAVRFCELLSRGTGRRVRLPSEAEWEYACRGGTATEFFFSPEGPFADDTGVPYRLRQALRDYAWFLDNSRDSTQPAGLKQPNPYGLHDMTGNVWEWCADFWHAHYAGAPADGSAWLEQRGTRPLRCLRGGAWDMNAFRCRSCYRSWDWEELATDRFGFRICVE